MSENREILLKGDLTLNDLATKAGELLPQKAATFFRIAIEQSKLMARVRTMPMSSPTFELDKAQFGSSVLRAGAEATPVAEADRAELDLSKITLNVKTFRAEVNLNDHVLEDNIERGSLTRTVMQLLAERIGLDIEDVVINSDTTSGTPLLAQFDGILKQATTNVVAGGQVPLTKAVFKAMWKAMPKPFRRNKSRMSFFVGANAHIDYSDYLADRIGVMADGMLNSGGSLRYQSTPIVDIDRFPEDQGGGSNETNVLLCDPKNIVVGMHRRVTIETERLVRSGVWVVVASMRFDVKYTHEPAVVKTTQIIA